MSEENETTVTRGEQIMQTLRRITPEVDWDALTVRSVWSPEAQAQVHGWAVQTYDCFDFVELRALLDFLPNSVVIDSITDDYESPLLEVRWYE